MCEQIWDKSAVGSLRSHIPLNHWSLLGAEIMPWTLAWIQNSTFSLSLSVESCCPQDVLGWSWRTYQSQESSPILYPTFCLYLLTHNPKYKHSSKKSSSGGLDKPQLGPSSPNLPLAALHSDQLTTSCEQRSAWIPNLTQRSKHLQPSSHDGSSKNQLSCGRPHLDDQVLWTHWGGGHPDECLLGGGVRKGNLWLSRSHWRCIRAPVWATLTKVWLTMGQSASLLSPKPTLYSGHSSSFSRPESGRDSAPPRETPSRPQLEDPTLGLSEDHQRDLPSFPYPMFTPLTCWHWPLSPHYQLTPKEPVG